jgi:hypothetical protein
MLILFWINLPEVILLKIILHTVILYSHFAEWHSEIYYSTQSVFLLNVIRLSVVVSF